MTFLQLLGGSSRFCQRVCQQPTSIHRVGLEEGAAAQRAALEDVRIVVPQGAEQVLRVAVVVLQDAVGVHVVERALLQLPRRLVHRLDQEQKNIVDSAPLQPLSHTPKSTKQNSLKTVTGRSICGDLQAIFSNPVVAVQANRAHK